MDKSLVEFVPQDDLVNPELTVEESLTCSGRLRMGNRVSKQVLENEVNRVLTELDIHHIRKSRIGDALRRGISGGQRKRVNLGQELMTRSTRILFLDEPMSGLDPRASQDIMSLTRQLADSGRIVFLVTHDLTPQVMAQVDHLLVLAPGGRLAHFGPPAEACRWFGVATPDAIFNRFGIGVQKIGPKPIAKGRMLRNLYKPENNYSISKGLPKTPRRFNEKEA